MIVVVATGPLATLQDLGRPGFAHLGVSASGALDRDAHRLANRLVGNPPEDATIEITFGGAILRCDTACLVAVTGAPCPTTGFDLGDQQPVAVPAGTTVQFGQPPVGVRSYVAVRGGFAVTPVLQSRATDVLGGIGPPPLAGGDVLTIGADPGTPVPSERAPRRWSNGPVLIHPGPRHDWFATDAADQLVGQRFTVLAASNRIGLRLSGPPLRRVRDGELASEGMIPGAIQVPPDGQPIVFLADHPATGGYPVIAVVDPGHLDRLAQRRPGDHVRFRWHDEWRARVGNAR